MSKRVKSNRPSVTVVIPTYNGAATISEVLRGVMFQRMPVSKILVVDSSSTDKTVEQVEETIRIAGAERLIRLLTIPKEEFHHARTRDFALSLCRTRFAVLLVQDAMPADAVWLESLLAPFTIKGELKLAASYSRILPRLDASPLSQRDVLMDDAASEKLKVFTSESARDCYYHHVSACVKRSAWKKLKFADAYENALGDKRDVPPGFGEDLCWSQGICSKGYKIAFMPESVVLHTHDYALRGVFERERQDVRLRAMLGFRGRKHLASVPLHAVHNATQDAGFTFISSSPLGRKLGALARSVPYRFAQGLGQWLGTKESKR